MSSINGLQIFVIVVCCLLETYYAVNHWELTEDGTIQPQVIEFNKYVIELI